MARLKQIQRIALKTVERYVADRLEAALLQEASAKGRGNRPAWVAAMNRQGWTVRETAAATLRVVLDVCHEDQTPSLLTVVNAITEKLGASPGGPRGRAVGVRLIYLAQLCGIVAFERGKRHMLYVHLTQDSELLRNIIAFANENLPPALRPATTPPHGAVIRKPTRGLIPPPDPPPEVEAAADSVQQTAFTINEYMLALHASNLGELAWRHLNRARHDPQVKGFKERDHVDAIGTASALRGQTFYLPASIDFRGRIYQTGAGALTYTSGSDTARSLLQFARAEPLSHEGLGWLTYHMELCYTGSPPALLRDGQMWVEDNREWIEACVRDPANNRQWLNAKKKHAFQFLAAAHAWVESRDGKPCALPVTADGTTSAMQHLCALTHDADLAPLVNLADRSSIDPFNPGDFYAEVATLAGEERPEVKDVLVPAIYGAGNHECGRVLAKSEDKERDYQRSKSIRREYQARAESILNHAHILAPESFAVLDWLHDVAKVAGERLPSWWQWRADWDGRIHLMQFRFHDCVQPVAWTTPTGLKVTLDPRFPVKKRLWLELPPPFGNTPVTRSSPGPDINPVGLETGIRADYVHSLDASLLTIILSTASQEGLDRFVAAHDCIGTHPNDMPSLMRIASSAFSTMYQAADWLELLADELRASGLEIDDPPARGVVEADWLKGCEPFY